MSALFGTQLDLLKSYFDQEPPYIIPDVPGIAITWLNYSFFLIY